MNLIQFIFVQLKAVTNKGILTSTGNIIYSFQFTSFMDCNKQQITICIDFY